MRETKTYQLGDTVYHKNFGQGKLISTGFDNIKDCYGVEFIKEVFCGHDCCGLGTDGYCHWVMEDSLSSI